MSSTNQNSSADGDVTTFAVAVRRTTSFRKLRRMCIDHFAANGVVMMSYHHLPPPGSDDYDPSITVAAHGFPEEWVDYYVSNRLYEVDPIPKRAMASTTPFRWSEMKLSPGLLPEELKYLETLSNAGIGDGLAVPVFGPHGRNGYAGLGFGLEEFELSEAKEAALQWACQLGHQAYCDLVRAKHPDAITLSPRECEILEWVARGKSNAVTAEILGISPFTVDTHLRRIYSKLGVADRVTAALRGLAVGVIS